ncbi:MAG: hypothetical protein U5K77_03500 [Candidatus Saccharibacteria bacterium]|nr:hypothetical protein [Candidatus Saccharibacteria bacterium]
MSETLLTLHIAGAFISFGVVAHGIASALLRKGVLQRIKQYVVTAAVYMIGTGAGLIMLRPSTAALATFCISGLAFTSMFAITYKLAAWRLSPQTLKR